MTVCLLDRRGGAVAAGKCQGCRIIPMLFSIHAINSHCRKISWTLVHRRLKMRHWSFYPPSVSSAFSMLRCQASHTEVSKQSRTKLCQTAGGKWSWSEPKKMAPSKLGRWCSRARKLALTSCPTSYYDKHDRVGRPEVATHRQLPHF